MRKSLHDNQIKAAESNRRVQALEETNTKLTNELESARQDLLATGTLADDLHWARNALTKKEKEASQLSSDLSVLQKWHAETTMSLSEELQFSLDGTEKLEDLRKHVFALANELLRSERARADLNEHLLNERAQHAESIRKMSEKAKKFYSTTIFGDS